MLVRAAADAWKVSPSSITVSKGVLTSGSKKGTFAQFAEAGNEAPGAGLLEAEDPKTENHWLLGSPARFAGESHRCSGFGQDILFPKLRTAVVLPVLAVAGVGKVVKSSALSS